MPNNRSGWRAAGWVACALALAAVAPAPAWALFGKDKELRDQLERASQQSRQLETTRVQLDQRLKDLEQQYVTLSQEHQNLKVDRDNLLAQVQQVQGQAADYQQVRAERDLLQQVLKKASDEERALRAQLAEHEDRLHAVQQSLEQVAQERERLDVQVRVLQDKSKERQFSQELNALRKEHGELSRVLNASQRELGETQKREAVAETRLKKLQSDYSQSVAENSQLRREKRTIPKDVVEITREHERLVKEAADMHYNMGVLFSEQKQYSRALTEFRKVVEIRPDDGDAYYNLGVIYAEHIPDREKSLQHFRRYLSLKPDAKDASWVKQYIASWRAWEGEERLD